MPYLLMFCAALVAACGILFNLWSNADQRADRAERALQNAFESQRIEHENAQKELAIARSQPAVTVGVRRLCHKISMPVTTSRPDDGARTDASSGLVERLAADVIACQRNSARLGSLQEWVRANSE